MERIRRTRALFAAGALVATGLFVAPRDATAHNCVGITPDADPDNCAGDVDRADHMCTWHTLALGRVVYVCTQAP